MLSLLEVEKVWAVKRRSIGPIDHTFISATVALSRTVFELTIVLHILQIGVAKIALRVALIAKSTMPYPYALISSIFV